MIDPTNPKYIEKVKTTFRVSYPRLPGSDEEWPARQSGLTLYIRPKHLVGNQADDFLSSLDLPPMTGNGLTDPGPSGTSHLTNEATAESSVAGTEAVSSNAANLAVKNEEEDPELEQALIADIMADFDFDPADDDGKKVTAFTPGRGTILISATTPQQKSKNPSLSQVRLQYRWTPGMSKIVNHLLLQPPHPRSQSAHSQSNPTLFPSKRQPKISTGVSIGTTKQNCMRRMSQ